MQIYEVFFFFQKKRTQLAGRKIPFDVESMANCTPNVMDLLRNLTENLHKRINRNEQNEIVGEIKIASCKWNHVLHMCVQHIG